MEDLNKLNDPQLWKQGPGAVALAAHEVFKAHADEWESDEPIWERLREQAPLHVPEGRDPIDFLGDVQELYLEL